MIEDDYKEERLDIVDRAGGNFKSLVLSYVVPVTDGFASIDFIPITENPKVSAVSVRSYAGSIPPTQSPVEVQPPTMSECIPSSGECAATSTKLQDFLDVAVSGDTISICNGATIFTSTALHSSRDLMLTLCCSGDDGCTIQSRGTDTNLSVTGGSFHVAGIAFVGGNRLSGGNLHIVGDGDHKISK